MNGLLQGRRGLIMGVANERSLAWGIAKEAIAHGAILAFTYPNEAVGRRVRTLVGNDTDHILIECDAASDPSLDWAFQHLSEHWRGSALDFVVHAISYSDKDELDGPYLSTSRQNFRVALDISWYSFTAIAQRAAPLMTNGGSLLTLTYIGAERVIPNYNVMGVAKAALEASVRYLAADLGPKDIRVNAISAGPIKTLASSGITGMRHIVRWSELNAPLRRATTTEDVGRAALSFISPLGQGITGEILHVDGGYNVVGMAAIDQAEAASEVLQQVGQQLGRRRCDRGDAASTT